ncbi:IS200/IS605 family transposase [Rhodohalobacter sulfatireducens]|uniref:IS200/IS605 family transposase n=1 Tax=Rhodohalobacter sulfatireducens TaxID=2911366 RepID=A0ABS9K8M4_9BACT|nr:IS200/IS605 family transposase [Rhodohalobacter sulfatireducens]MCG2587186.1 IS200/IS605 family transposase [Rhodohalobacter sulfatireducens]
MANTYTQLYIQFVFAVQNRISLIRPEWEEMLYRYMTGIIQNKSHKMIAINGMPDHIHMFIGFEPVDHMSELIKVVKGESSKWIRKKGFVKGRFNWQSGYGAFSYSRSHIDRVYHYIHNQEEHHKKKTFREEYIELLEKFDVEYDERYIFQPVEY